MTNAPRLCYIGPMIGRHPGHVTIQAQIVSGLFAHAGYRVISASSSLNRYVRLADTTYTIIRHRRVIDIASIAVFGGPSLIVEDVASFLCKRLGIPFVMVLHGGNMPTFMARYPNWCRRVLSRANALVAPSDY